MAGNTMCHIEISYGLITFFPFATKVTEHFRFSLGLKSVFKALRYFWFARSLQGHSSTAVFPVREGHSEDATCVWAVNIARCRDKQTTDGDNFE